ncbi:helix-turn-helix domain-containing protein [Liquorilactobacillus hordei DSM 19519]|nr:helix-turn-helix domain-containing protein [Liquorilactobacillus hordei DSM 19519]
MERFFMTKYTFEFKVKLVQEYWNGDVSYSDLMRKYNIPSMITIRKWVLQASVHGLSSLKAQHTKKVYSQDFKLFVVNYVKTHEVSQMAVAAHFGITFSRVNSWVNTFQKMGAAGLRKRPRGRPASMTKSTNKKLNPSAEEKYKEEILKLKAQLQETEMERDILKALAAMRHNQRKH